MSETRVCVCVCVYRCGVYTFVSVLVINVQTVLVQIGRYIKPQTSLCFLRVKKSFIIVLLRYCFIKVDGRQNKHEKRGDFVLLFVSVLDKETF